MSLLLVTVQYRFETSQAIYPLHRKTFGVGLGGHHLPNLLTRYRSRLHVGASFQIPFLKKRGKHKFWYLISLQRNRFATFSLVKKLWGAALGDLASKVYLNGIALARAKVRLPVLKNRMNHKRQRARSTDRNNYVSNSTVYYCMPCTRAIVCLNHPLVISRLIVVCGQHFKIFKSA
jgi:hypothetical protein